MIKNNITLLLLLVCSAALSQTPSYSVSGNTLTVGTTPYNVLGTLTSSATLTRVIIGHGGDTYTFDRDILTIDNTNVLGVNTVRISATFDEFIFEEAAGGSDRFFSITLERADGVRDTKSDRSTFEDDHDLLADYISTVSRFRIGGGWFN